MQGPDRKKRSIVILCLAACAFIAHWLGLLETIVLGAAALAGALAALQLLSESPAARRRLEGFLNWMERKVLG